MDQNSPEKNRIPFTERIARLIVKYRFIFFALFLAFAVYCIFGVSKVRVNSDLAAFLPEDTETRRAISLMDEEFETFGSLRVMVEDISLEDANKLKEKLAAVPHVFSVSFDESEKRYSDGCALFGVSFDLPEDDENALAAAEEVRKVLSPYTCYYSSDFGRGSYSEQLAQEMVWVMLLAVVVIVAVLLFTSRSFFEVVVYFIVFLFAGLFNMGTNFWLGEISTITNTVAVILQLALAIDYAIIFAHSYQSQCEKTQDSREALIQALARSIKEISSSSLTTIAGLIALTLMQFRLGYDLGVVLAKGIVFSMLTVFLLMPGLILLFPRLLRKSSHRSFVPKIDRFGRFVAKRRLALLLIFALILPFAVIFSSNVNYSFYDRGVTQIIPSERRTANEKVDAIFGSDTTFALILPKSDDYASQKALINELRALEGVTSVTGLAGVPLTETLSLGDSVTCGEASSLLGVDDLSVRMLFIAYAMKVSAPGEVYADISSYKVPILDLAQFVFEKLDAGALTLSDEQMQTANSLRAQLEIGQKQLSGKTKDRIALTTDLAVDDERSLALLERARAAAEKIYGEGSVVVAGDITVARDLKGSYQSDSVLIAVLTIVFIFLILLVTFRSVVVAAALVFVIQGSIWINFSFAYIFSMRPSFVTQMIVTAIEMGATIDYAIVLTSKYLAARKTLPPKEAVVRAMSDSFPTVLTSGAIMTVAGLLIAFRVSDVYVGHIGLAVGRGAFISALLVLTVLPQFLLLLDKAIEKTTIRFKKRKETPKNER